MNLHVAGFSGGQGSKAGGIGYSEETAPTIKASPSGSNQAPDIICVHGSQDPICNTDHANAVNRNRGLENVICRATQQGNSECCKNLAPTLTAAAGKSGNNQPIVLCFSANDNGRDICRNISPTIRKGGTTTADGGNGVGAQVEIAYPQNCSGVMGVCTDEPSETTVRRLTPLECERLMGFPDNYTRISWNGKPETSCPDAPRYKACGNSMCVNVMRWIGIQIQRIEEENHK